MSRQQGSKPRATTKKQGDAPPRPIQPPVVDSVSDDTRTPTYAELAQSDKKDDLDEYLKKEFPDDWQTDDPKKGVLSDYVKGLFTEAKTPKAMKVEIDAVDYRVKAYYLLSLLRATEKNTNLRSAVPKPQLWKPEDFLNTNNLGTVQTAKQRVTQIAGYPHMIGSNFVFNDEKLLSVYNNVVVPLVSRLWEGGTRDRAENVEGVIARLGDHYGLERIIDQLEKNPGRRPKRGNKPQGTDEEIVERNLLRFALFGAKNYADNLTFVYSGKDGDKNVHALKIAFDDDKEPGGEKETFARADFPEKLKLAAYPFFAKAADSIGREKIGDNLKGLKTYLTEFEKMATPYGAMPPQTGDVDKAKAAAAAAAEAAKEAAAVTTDKKGQTTDVPAPPSAAEDAPATTGEAQDIKQTAAVDVAAPASDFIPFTGDEPSECKELVAQLVQYESQVNTLNNTLESFRTAASGAATLIQQQQTLIDQLSALKGEKFALEGTQAEIKAKLIACEGEKNSLQTRIDALEVEIASLKKRIAELEAREAVLKNVIEKLVVAINSQQDKLNAIEDLLAKVDLQAKDLTEGDASQKIQQLQDNLVTRADQIVQKIAALKDQLAAAQKNYDDLKAQFDALQKRLEECEGETGQKVTRLDALGKSEIKLREELKRCSDSHITLLASYRKFCDDNKTFLTRVNSEMNRVVADFNSPLDALTKAIASGKEKLAAAEGNLPEGVATAVQVIKGATAETHLGQGQTGVGEAGEKSLGQLQRMQSAVGPLQRTKDAAAPPASTDAAAAGAAGAPTAAPTSE